MLNNYSLFSAAARLRQLCPILHRHTQRSLTHSQALSTCPEVIQVTPKVSLFDQKVHIRIKGLPSKAKVTLHATTQQEWRKKPVEFMSCSHYITSSDGDLDLNQDASVGGTYTGMQVFWFGASMCVCVCVYARVRMQWIRLSCYLRNCKHSSDSWLAGH